MHVAHKTCYKATQQVPELSRAAFIFREISRVSLMDFHTEDRTQNKMWFIHKYQCERTKKKKMSKKKKIQPSCCPLSAVVRCYIKSFWKAGPD